MNNSHQYPPQFFLRFFRWFCHPELRGYIEGDLMELYKERRKAQGKRKADLRFCLDVILLFRPGIIRPSKNKHLTTYGMYKSYFKIGWRNMVRNKGQFAINITGLAIGITTCLIITLFITDEFSFDRYNNKADQIVRVVLKGNLNGEEIKEAVTPAPVGPTLKEEFPEVEADTRIRSTGSHEISYQGTTFRNDKLAFVDPNFFDVFTLPFIMGNPETALQEPNTIVITRKMAIKYFGDDDPINKVLDIKDLNGRYKITGVIDKVPANSHFHFDLFASMTGVADAKVNNWMASNYYNYLLLARGTDIKTFESKLPGVVAKYMGPQMSQIGMTYEKFREGGNRIGLYIQPLTDIHLSSEFGQTELEPGGNLKIIYILGAVAIFMLLIACINFMNLSTAAAVKRSKELGVKKVLGSRNMQLVEQFMAESFISTWLAMFLAVILIVSGLPLFNHLSGKELQADFLLKPDILAGIFLLVILITFLAGGYPASYLSSLKPIAALKTKLSGNRRNIGIRSALVVFQFVVSTGLIIAIIIVNQQILFIKNTAIGYNRNHLLVLHDSYLLGDHESVFRNMIQSDPGVERVTMSAFVPAGASDNNMTDVYPGDQHESIRRMLVYNIDEQYIPTMGMKLEAGRNFTGNGDSSNVIINETAVKTFDPGENPLGMTLTINNGKRKVTVIGVVKDFHFRSLHEAIAPLLMLYNPYGGLIIKTNTDNTAGLISSINKEWKSFNTGEPFSYAMLDDLYNNTYQAEQKMDTILEIFAALTVFVACLGLFGLVTFTTEQRVKEIGIRKVLGANISQIVSILSKDLLLLVLISFLIAFPLGFYLMNKWLQDFVYRIQIHWWVFLLAGFTVVLVAFLTMSIKTVKYAMINPVVSLRSE